MEFNDQPVTTPARAAATVVLLRDADDGMEVFMVKRHGLSDVLGGACVFPGGKLDPADAAPDTLERLNTPLDHLHTALGEPELDAATAAGLFVAACRETFEEAGVLLAEGATALHVDAAQARAREGLSFSDVLAGLELRLDCGNVVPWMRWVTPRVPMMLNKRFDARFFLAAVPHDQQPQHDNHEATEGFWLKPRAALERYWAGEINLAPAQIMSLAELSRLRDVAGALAAAQARRPPVIQPEVFTHEKARAVAFPGDARHPVPERALPGPSCLVFRNERFEPVGGFEALFA
ncbi:MAG: NUDIX hydrolase [Betaproteobacteria bacterium]|nr:NUDIX hydrolase [Betaproteobacteria bacterium]